MRKFTTIALGVLLASAVPVDAQVYPDRIASVVRERAGITRVERYQGNDQRETQTERLTKTVRIGADGALDLSNISGDIVVTRGGGNDVTIEAVKTGRGRTAELAKQALDAVTVEIVERGNRVEVRARYPNRDETRRRNRRDFSASVAFTITAPERARIIASSISGDLSVTDIKGDLALETISGDVSVANAGRVSKAKTASGDVSITDTSIEGTMEAATISGTMQLRNVKARRLDVGSVSGDVVLQNVDCERTDAQSISGDVRFTGPLVRGGRYDLGSHSGEVRVIISGNVGFELDASSFSGSVRTDFDLKTSGTEPASRGRARKSLSGTYGDGSAFLDLTTFSGSVIIARQ